MTKAAVLHNYFNSFGIPAYVSTSIPDFDDVTFPYLTYELSVSSWLRGEVDVTVQIYYYTESEAIPNAKADEVFKAVNAQPILPCDDGYIWIKGADAIRAVPDDVGCKTKRMNVTIEYLSE